MAGISESQFDERQGEGIDGRDYGYVSGEDGGFFFTYFDTLDETVESVEEDEVDGGGGLTEEEVQEFLRHHLPIASPRLYQPDA